MAADNSKAGKVSLGMPVWTDVWAAGKVDTASNDGASFVNVVKLHRAAAA
jgi:hypothetical protein